MSARLSFDKELSMLNDDLKEMGERIEDAIDKVMTAFQEQDIELANEIISNDRRINDMEKAIETRCLSLIMRQQPVARDLRSVTTALKVVTDMERIGDHAADISEMIIRIGNTNAYGFLKPIPEMASAAKRMVHDAVDAFINYNVESAQKTILMDDIVDDLFNQVKMEVIRLLRESSEHADICIDVMMIAKYLERIGDHAVNICEWTEFHETGALNNVRLI